MGLTLDLIGAAVIAIGLFRSSAPQLLGWDPDPLQAASDQASGVVGILFLGSGFIIQGLPSFGLFWEGSGRAALLLAFVVLVAGSCAAWLLYEVTRRLLFAREKAYTGRTYMSYAGELVFRPHVERKRGVPLPRLWRFRSTQTPD